MIFHFRRPLPPGFEWRERGVHLSILCGHASVLTVSPARGGWLITIHLGANGGPTEIVAISKLRAVGWANRWVTSRARTILTAARMSMAVGAA